MSSDPVGVIYGDSGPIIQKNVGILYKKPLASGSTVVLGQLFEKTVLNGKVAYTSSLLDHEGARVSIATTPSYSIVTDQKPPYDFTISQCGNLALLWGGGANKVSVYSAEL